MAIPWENLFYLFYKNLEREGVKIIKLKLKGLKRGFGCVYKIDYPNGKCYIGATKDLKRRFWEHNNLNKNVAYNDEAVAEFGRVEEVEILYKSNDTSELEEVEKYWIEKLDSTNPKNGYNVSVSGNAYGRKGDDNPLSKVSDEEVKNIRIRKMNNESRKDVYKDYNKKLTLKGGFDRIWNGESRKDIMPEIVEKFNSIDKPTKISNALKGENNERSKINKDTVREIRRIYNTDKYRMDEIADMFPKLSYNIIRRVCKNKTWKHVK